MKNQEYKNDKILEFGDAYSEFRKSFSEKDIKVFYSVNKLLVSFFTDSEVKEMFRIFEKANLRLNSPTFCW